MYFRLTLSQHFMPSVAQCVVVAMAIGETASGEQHYFFLQLHEFDSPSIMMSAQNIVWNKRMPQ
jgi:hypothetical protein